MSRHKRSIAAVAVLTAIALALAWVENGVQPGSDTSGFRAYENSDLGFSLQYPVHWSIDIDPNASNIVTFTDPNDFSEDFIVAVLSPQDEPGIRAAGAIERESEFRVSGLTGREIWQKLDGWPVRRIILVGNGGRLFVFSGGAKDFDLILQSVKIINQ